MKVGQTLLKVKVPDPARRYVGFETNPRCCQYVEELIAVNRFAESTIVPAGLSDRSGLTMLWLRPNVSFDPAATTITDTCVAPMRCAVEWDVFQETTSALQQSLIWAFQSDPGAETVTIKPSELDPQTVYDARSADVGRLGPVSGAYVASNRIGLSTSTNQHRPSTHSDRAS